MWCDCIVNEREERLAHVCLNYNHHLCTSQIPAECQEFSLVLLSSEAKCLVIAGRFLGMAEQNEGLFSKMCDTDLFTFPFTGGGGGINDL